MLDIVSLEDFGFESLNVCSPILFDRPPPADWLSCRPIIYLTLEMAGHSFVRPWLQTKGTLFFISSSINRLQEDLGGAAACSLETKIYRVDGQTAGRNRIVTHTTSSWNLIPEGCDSPEGCSPLASKQAMCRTWLRKC